MRKYSTPSQRTVGNIRKRLRDDMERLALTHRGCKTARGCGCLVDLSLTALHRCEATLFDAEILSYSDPSTPRRLVTADNSISIEIPHVNSGSNTDEV